MALFIIGAFILIILYSVIARRIFHQVRRQQRRHSFSFGVYFESGGHSLCSSPTENKVLNCDNQTEQKNYTQITNHTKYSFHLKKTNKVIDESIDFSRRKNVKVVAKTNSNEAYEIHASKFKAGNTEISKIQSIYSSEERALTGNEAIVGKQSFSFSTIQLDKFTSNLDKKKNRFLSLPVLPQYKCKSQSLLAIKSNKQLDLDITTTLKKKDNETETQTNVLDSNENNQIEKKESKSKG